MTKITTAVLAAQQAELAAQVAGLGANMAAILAAIQGSPAVPASVSAGPKATKAAKKAASLESLRLATQTGILPDATFTRVLGASVAKATVYAKANGGCQLIYATSAAKQRDYVLFYGTTRKVPKGGTLIGTIDAKGKLHRLVEFGQYMAVQA